MKLAPMMTLLCLAALAGLARAAERPNIVVFLVDDMGLMDSSVPFLTDAEGSPQRFPLNDFYRTPNMQRLAKQGLRLSNFYAMSVCSPTRIAIMTGQTSARHHTTNWINPESNNRGKFGPPDWQWQGIVSGQQTLAALLAAAGYRTIHCGKGHFGAAGSFGEEPKNFGFDVNIAGCSYGQPGSYYGTDDFGNAKPGRVHRGVPGLEKYHGQEIYLTEALTREMNAAIAAAVREQQPFFAYMAHYAVHAPFQVDPRFVGNYSEKPPRVAAFASMIEGMDKSLGDILDQLETLGVAEDTLVLFLGDNGTDAPLGPDKEIACAAPLRGKKGTHYEGGMRVPFIAAWARPSPDNPHQQRTPVARGEILDDLGAVYDLFPTILNVAGIGEYNHETIDGVNLTPILAGKSNPGGPREFLMHFPHQHRSSYFTVYRRGDWKLVYHYRQPAGQRCQLFNLTVDRDESHNVAKAEPARLREMMAAMLSALAAADAQFPLAEDQQTPLIPRLADRP